MSESATEEKEHHVKKSGRKIKFNFHPFEFENRGHAVEKTEGDKKRRYLKGIASGIAWDAHDEKMTKGCIKSFHDQASSGQVLLYADVHGIKSTEAIGILAKSDITKNNDWVIDARLFDKDDDMPEAIVGKAQVAWKMANGLHPFKKSSQFGFSIEGIIPDDGVEREEPLGRRILNKIDLDGVVLVPRPAYKDSIAQAISKSLGEPSYYKAKKTLSDSLRERSKRNEDRASYFDERWSLDQALDELIEQIMINPNVDKRQQLEIALDEYKELLINTLIENQEAFDEKVVVEVQPTIEINKSKKSKKKKSKGKLVTTGADIKRQKLWKGVYSSLEELIKIRNRRT